MRKIKYIPLFDELCYFFFYRAQRYIKRRIFRNQNIHRTVRMGDNCKFDRNIRIGAHTYFGDNCHLFAGDHSYVDIGECCAIGYNVHIKARTHDLAQPTRTQHISQNLRKESNIQIGNYVWVGDNVFIKEGVTIEDHAIIAANSVVVKNVKSNEIVGGIPAKLIRINHELDKKKYE